MRDDEFRSHIMDIMNYRITRWEEFTTSLIKQAYNATPASSPLRAVIVKATIAGADQESLNRRIKSRQLPNDFAADLIEQMFTQIHLR